VKTYQLISVSVSFHQDQIYEFVQQTLKLYTA